MRTGNSRAEHGVCATGRHNPLLDRVYQVAALDDVVTEKGEKLFAKRALWAKKSVFGVMKAICEATRPGTCRAPARCSGI